MGWRVGGGLYVCGVREREREREGGRDRQSDRQTDRETDRETDRDRQRQRDILTERYRTESERDLTSHVKRDTTATEP